MDLRWVLPLFLLFALNINAGAKDPAPIDFAHNVAPIIKLRCAECHTNGKYKGSFSMDTREDLLKSMAVRPGKSGITT